jgi:hypothetical protein
MDNFEIKLFLKNVNSQEMPPVMFQSPGPTNPIQQQVLSAHHFTHDNHIEGALFLTLKFKKP